MERLDAWILPGNRLVAAWCCFCRRWHFHDAGPNWRMAGGSRVAHCLGRSTVYELNLHGPAPPEIGSM